MTDFTNKSSLRPGRPANKREALVSWLLEKLVSGELKPGDKLPRREELSLRFEASSHTVQDAMDQLASDGHIISRSTSGTFVSQRPPHLHRFGLVFLETPDYMPFWSHFYRAIIDVAPRVAATRGCEVDNYFIHNGDSRHPDYSRFLFDLTRRRLAGVVFTIHPGNQVNSPLITLTPTPRVMIASGFEAKGVPSIYSDHEKFLEDAMAYLRDVGHKRVAVFDWLGAGWHDCRSALARFGLQSRPQWQYPSQPHMTDSIRHYVQVLLDRPEDQRPDALLVTDDNLVSAVSQGVAASGLTAPSDIEIVSHANFPSLPEVATPVTWIGFDIRELMSRSFDCLQSISTGQPTPALTIISPSPMVSTVLF